MPEILEKAEAAATRKLGPLPVIAWIGIGVGGFVVFHLLTGGPGGSSSAVSAPGMPDGYDPSGIGGGGGTGSGDGGTITTPPAPVGTPPPVPGSKPGQYKLSLAGPTKLYTTTGKELGSGSSGTYTATKIHLLGQDFYRFLRGGRWTLVHVNAKTIKVT